MTIHGIDTPGIPNDADLAMAEARDEAGSVDPSTWAARGERHGEGDAMNDRPESPGHADDAPTAECAEAYRSAYRHAYKQEAEIQRQMREAGIK